MQALRDEMALRDQTRELDAAEEALEHEEFVARAQALSVEQKRISDHTQSAADDIVDLPNGEQRFAKELGLLRQVVPVMNEARAILREPNVGNAAVAAETEAIELLLETKRQKPGSGGGGADPGGGGTAPRASSAALTDIGPGNDAGSIVGARPVGQSTGRAGREFPAEFKSGLDAYFNNLEGAGRNP